MLGTAAAFTLWCVVMLGAWQWSSFREISLNAAYAEFVDASARIGYIAATICCYIKARQCKSSDDAFMTNSFGHGCIIFCLLYGSILNFLVTNRKTVIWSNEADEWMCRITITVMGWVIYPLGMILNAIYAGVKECFTYTHNECIRAREKLENID